MASAPERKLTTLLAADVAGYSRLMEADEEGTLVALNANLDSLKGLVESYRGRIVNTAGDGILAEFASVVEAVRCAVDIQRELGARNENLPENQRLRFRIGINLGDVIVENGNLFGEGVNIAARLQALAEPGGICIAGAVHDQVKNKLALGYDFLGDKSVKNIAAPVTAYRIDFAGGPTADRSTPPRFESVPPVAPSPVPPLPQSPRFPDTRTSPLSWADKRTRVLLLVAALLFTIDLLTDGRITWAYYPALVFVFITLVRRVLRT